MPLGTAKERKIDMTKIADQTKWTTEAPKNGLYWLLLMEGQGSVSAYPILTLKLVRIRGRDDRTREILFYEEYNNHGKVFKDFMTEQKITSSTLRFGKSLLPRRRRRKERYV